MIPELKDYHRPSAIDQAIELLEDDPENRVYLAGGTQLIPEKLESYREVVDLQQLGLDRLEPSSDQVEIGALCSISRIQKSEQLSELGLDGLVRAATNKPSQLIRNQATVGGELAGGESRSDLATVLRALPADITIQGPEGERTVPIDQFYDDDGQPNLDASELITAITVPALTGDNGLYYDRVARTENDRPLVSVAIFLERDGDEVLSARVAAGGVGEGILRFTAVEDAIDSASDPETAGSEVESVIEGTIDPPDDFRVSADYRKTVTSTLIRRGLESLDGRS